MIQAAPLPHRPLGNTGLEVTSLCIGCAPLGSMQETFAYSVAEEQAFATIRAIFAGPVNFLDTAASYGDGESERRLGMVLRGLGGLPAGFVLASKADRDLQRESLAASRCAAVWSAACACWGWTTCNCSICMIQNTSPLNTP